MADEQFQERTEQATPRRLEKAREEGRVVKSMELSNALMIGLGISALFVLGPQVSRILTSIMSHTMNNATFMAPTPASIQAYFRDHMEAYFIAVLPVFAVMLVIGMGSQITQIGFRITPKAMEPKLEKLNPLKGLKRIFSLKTAVHLVRDVIKLTIVGIVGWSVIAQEFPQFFALPDLSVAQFAIQMAQLAMIVALKIGAAVFVLAILDYLYQKYEHNKSLKMSKQEIKDESKDTEGLPQTKSRIRQIQREMSRRRMMNDVPTADVVITNPTHIAVALKYDVNDDHAPVVIAKGERLIAQRIKEIARASGVPCFEDKPLARALFRTCEVGQAIPQALYRAVAEVLAFVYRTKTKQEAR